MFKPKKAKTVLESWKVVNNERKKYEMDHKIKEVKISTTLFN